MSYVVKAGLEAAAVAVALGGAPVVQEALDDDPSRMAYQSIATPRASPLAARGPYGPAEVIELEPGEGNLPLPSEPDQITSNDCDVEPRSREDVLQVLSVSTSEDGEALLAFDINMNEGRTIDRETFDTLVDVHRAWLACAQYGKTYERLALEADNLIRARVYNTYGFQTTPYSTSTLEEILSGWVEVDKAGPGPIGVLNFYVQGLVLDPTVLFVSDDGTMISMTVSHGQSVDGVWRVIESQVTTVEFVLEDGYWRILFHGDVGRG
jgi:hypothetical protein